MEQWVVLIMVCLGAWMDIKTREISGWFLWGFGAAGLVFAWFYGSGWEEWVFSSLPGIMLLLFGRISGGGIGEGDGWFFVITGLFLEVHENIWLLASGFCLCMFAGLFLVAKAHWKGMRCQSLRLPFLPFLVPGSICLTFF